MMTLVRLLPSSSEARFEVLREVDIFIPPIKVAGAVCALEEGDVTIAMVTSLLFTSFGVVTSLMGVDVSVGHRPSGWQ
ncbi:unnamed protein product [Echinostoma caproni]|uniref:H(+)-exporting diphosphatase n=1 Tax=Echinostoma caproni TaxID=27848 RepID=A0A183BD71_9TREM|nr:unnamed protein product [Echinostoma caproni]